MSSNHMEDRMAERQLEQVGNVGVRPVLDAFVANDTEKVVCEIGKHQDIR